MNIEFEGDLNVALQYHPFFLNAFKRISLDNVLIQTQMKSCCTSYSWFLCKKYVPIMFIPMIEYIRVTQ